MNVREAHNYSCECECGMSKRTKSVSCDRCTFLDGNTAAIAFVIGAIRTLGSLTVAQMNALSDAPSLRSTTRAIAWLLKRGRLRAFDDVSDDGHACNLYTLIEPVGMWS